MSRLLRAGFARLFQSKLFYLSLAIGVFLGCFAGYTKYSDLLIGIPIDLSDTLFSCGYIAAFVLSVFTPLFVGTEYSDGVIRNKIISGHERWAIYLSNQILAMSTGAMVFFSFVIPHAVIMYLVAGSSRIAARQLLIFALVSFIAVLTCCSIYILISMLSSKKSTSVVLCMLLVILMFITAMTVSARLSAEEYRSGYRMSDSGEIESFTEPNPKYLTGIKRAVYQTVYDILPIGQILQALFLSISKPWLLIIYSLTLSSAVTAIGIGVFSKKDLN